MAEELEKLIEGAEEISVEHILNQLYKKDKLRFHTEINKPLNITALDATAKIYEDIPPISKILKSTLHFFRINMVAFQRKRATETIDAFKALFIFEMEKRKRAAMIQEAMLGR